MSDLTTRLRELSKAVSDGRPGEFTMRIPAEPKRDADIVLSDAADLIEQLQSRLDRGLKLMDQSMKATREHDHWQFMDAAVEAFTGQDRAVEKRKT